MKKFILILSLSFMSVCTLAQGPSYPEGTVLGLKIDEVPNLPECTEQDIKAGQTNTRCMSKFIVGDRDWETTIILIPEQENNLPFPVSISYYTMKPIADLRLTPHDGVHSEEVINYLSAKYGDPINYRNYGHLETYEFPSEEMSVTLNIRSNGHMNIIFESSKP